MKLQLIVVMLLVLVSTINAQTTDKDAILQIAKAETECYYKGDSAKWASYRVQSKDASFTFAGPNGFSHIKGWDSISKFLNPAASRSNLKSFKVEITDPVVRINGDLAFAAFNQATTATTADTTVNGSTVEMRVFNKVNGKWKILTQVTTSTTPTNPNSDVVIEDDLNRTGYKLLTAKKTDDAIEVFKLNVKLHPDAWNPYDSLGEAYAIAGNNALAIENYEKSVRLNPKNENGINILKKLSKQ